MKNHFDAFGVAFFLDPLPATAFFLLGTTGTAAFFCGLFFYATAGAFPFDPLPGGAAATAFEVPLPELYGFLIPFDPFATSFFAGGGGGTAVPFFPPFFIASALFFSSSTFFLDGATAAFLGGYALAIRNVCSASLI